MSQGWMGWKWYRYCEHCKRLGGRTTIGPRKGQMAGHTKDCPHPDVLFDDLPKRSSEEYQALCDQLVKKSAVGDKKPGG